MKKYSQILGQWPTTVETGQPVDPTFQLDRITVCVAGWCMVQKRGPREAWQMAVKSDRAHRKLQSKEASHEVEQEEEEVSFGR